MIRPWLKFYPSDWRADPRLRMCSLAARGLWIDLMSYMHEGEPYGYLTIDGMQPAVSGIAALVGRPVNEVVKALAELEARNVFSRAPNGAIYSRRMVRDKAKSDKDSENGKGGGNPALLGQDNGGVNPQPNGGDKAQKLEARNQTFGVLDSEIPSSPVASLGSSTSSNPRVATIGPDWPADYAEQFWAKYPNKVGKAAALRKLERIAKSSRVTFADLMAGLDRYVNKTDDRPWCNPETWLNGERWTDVPPAPRPPTQPRPGSKDDTRERTNNALAQLRSFAESHANDRGGGGDPGEPDAGFLPLAKPARS